MCTGCYKQSRCFEQRGLCSEYQSERKLKLLCNPQNLPEPTLSQPTLPDMQTASEDTKYAVRDFFADRVLKSKKKARERGWR